MTSATSAIPAGLSAERVAALCGAAAQQVAVRVVAQTGSTNDDLLAEVRTLERPTLLWAQQQTAGRGRAGRSWHAAEGATLTFSLAWKFSLPLHALVGLPLAVGVTVADVLALYAIDVHLKWPNDLLRDGRKLGGILIETARDGDSCWAVIGIGINMALPQQLDGATAAIAAAAPELQADRGQVIAALTTALAENLALFEQQGFAAFAARWNMRHAHAGKQVNIIDRGAVMHSGRAAGVDAQGCLQLDTAQGRVAIVAGDVSLRAAEN
jgi:BirA family transcriptional regulator, biotin operon repressor / biotin---[acetyl-CoA-carboxylase] ligase